MKQKTKSVEPEKPFKYILSNEQQTFLEELKTQLKLTLQEPIDEDNYNDILKEHLIIEVIFTLPVVEQNLYLIRLFGSYPSLTALADDLNITKQTICTHINKTKKYILKYVNSHYKPYYD